MKRRFCLSVVLLLALGIAASPAHAAVGPVWDVRATWGDTNLPPGGEGQMQVQARNIGDEPSEAALAIVDELPPGVTAKAIHWENGPGGTDLTADPPFASCSGAGAGTVTCTMTGALLGERSIPFPGGGDFKGYLPTIFIDVEVGAGASGSAPNVARVQGGGDPTPFEDTDQVPFDLTPSPFGIVPGSFLADLFSATYPEGQPVRQAGDHPFEQRADFELDQLSGVGSDGTRYVGSNGTLRTAEVVLPRGFVANPEATPKCDPVDFAEEGSTKNSTECPADTQVGYLNAPLGVGTLRYGQKSVNCCLEETSPNAFGARVPIYSLVPPKGKVADLGFNIASLVQGHIYGTPDPAHDYAIKTLTPDISALSGLRVRSSEVTVWGVPGDPTHDRFRFYPKETEGKVVGAPWGSASIKPFFTAPSDCGFENGSATISVESYEDPGVFTAPQESPDPLDVERCEDARFRFEPKISLQPTSRDAGGPTGLTVHLEVPQRNDETPEPRELYAQNEAVKGIATPPIKKAVVTLPEGMTLNPSAAQGLASCSSAQIGLGTNTPVQCPDASQFGTLTLHTPILPVSAPPKGFIYIAKQNDNPFHDLLALYLVIEEPNSGILVKVPGRVDLNQETGQIVTTFDDLPQFPVSDMEMNFKGGVRAGLVNPPTCGQKTIRAEFFSWQDPFTPHLVESSFEVTQNPDGSPCFNALGQRPFGPSLEAGTANNAAGKYSPLLTRFTRSDLDQEISRLDLKLPEGLTAKLAGVSECPEAGIAQAVARSAEGDGAAELAQPSCPASSLIGSVEAGAGVGVPLTFVPGKIYLAGPYKGGPLSVVVITPAVVGPFDLGVVVTRAALDVNTETAQVTTVSDPLPLIFHGVPVRLRDLRLNVDRHEFTLNPTSCAEKQFEARVGGVGNSLTSTADDTVATVDDRFQAADCASLPFHPKLSFRLKGKTNRGAHPAFSAVLTMKPGEANMSRVQVTLPHAEFLDNAHILNVCTHAQFAGAGCPSNSILGFAKAETPLFDQPLEGPVYLMTGFGHRLPDVAIDLKGEISVLAHGKVDTGVTHGLRNTFEVVPDAPLRKFTISLSGGSRGLIQNSESLCAKPQHAIVVFNGQNGKRVVSKPLVKTACGKKSRPSRRGKAGRRQSRR